MTAGTRPALALPVGPEGRDEMAMAKWPRAGGAWAAFERDVARAVTHQPTVIFDSDGGRWLATGGAGTLDGTEMLVARVGGSDGWALVRVRVTVEVLDGVL